MTVPAQHNQVAPLLIAEPIIVIVMDFKPIGLLPAELAAMTDKIQHLETARLPLRGLKVQRVARRELGHVCALAF